MREACLGQFDDDLANLRIVGRDLGVSGGREAEVGERLQMATQGDESRKERRMTVAQAALRLPWEPPCRALSSRFPCGPLESFTGDRDLEMSTLSMETKIYLCAHPYDHPTSYRRLKDTSKSQKSLHIQVQLLDYPLRPRIISTQKREINRRGCTRGGFTQAMCYHLVPVSCPKRKEYLRAGTFSNAVVFISMLLETMQSNHGQSHLHWQSISTCRSSVIFRWLFQLVVLYLHKPA